MRRTLFAGAAAIALVLLGAQTAAAQTVRDHRQNDACSDSGATEQPVVRDHRTQATVRDHRTQPVVRDHREGLPAPVVRDHRTADTCAASEGVVGEQPIVRDHRQGQSGPIVRDHRTQRFIVRALSLHADDETGPDFTGSDEIIAVFSDAAGQRRRATSVFGDFDTGETRRFRASENCITPIAGEAGRAHIGQQWNCEAAGAGEPLSFRITLLEVDDWQGHLCAIAAGFIPRTNGCLSDLVGNAAITLSPQKLSTVPQGGLIETVRIGGYTLTYVVQSAQVGRP